MDEALTLSTSSKYKIVETLPALQRPGVLSLFTRTIGNADPCNRYFLWYLLLAQTLDLFKDKNSRDIDAPSGAQEFCWPRLFLDLCYYNDMEKKQQALWFQVVTIILILFGLLYACIGLQIFSGPPANLIPRSVLLPWESALYGAIMLGWGTTLLLLGRSAFKRNDAQLKRILLIGLAVWLAAEALASAWLGVWFNVGVDVVVFTLFAIPLWRR